jgi:hypothetical protein
MTENQAGRAANKIYKAVNARLISASKALDLLDSLSPFMSTTQFHKLMDFQYAVKHNPGLYA